MLKDEKKTVGVASLRLSGQGFDVVREGSGVNFAINRSEVS